MKRIKNFSKILLLISFLSLLFHIYISFLLTDFCFWNSGVIFGLMDFLNPSFLIISMTFLLIFTCYIFWKSYPKYWEIILVLVISSLGNILDRVFHGAVCDYIGIELLIKLPVFNLNDIFISISLFFILIIVLYESIYCKKTGQ